MSLEINVDVWQSSVGFVVPLRTAVEATLQTLEIREAGVTVKLVGEAEMRELHRTYAGVDHATDVLSFPAGEVEPDSGQPYLGDVVVCPDIAVQAAARGGHSLTQELTLLTVHGVLHLLGYDHDEPERKQEMWELQSTILQRLGAQALAERLP